MRRLALAAVRVYRQHLSRYSPPCRHRPTCSTYALDQFTTRPYREALPAVLARLRQCREATT